MSLSCIFSKHTVGSEYNFYYISQSIIIISIILVSHYRYCRTYELPLWQCQVLCAFEETGTHCIPHVAIMVFLLMFQLCKHLWSCSLGSTVSIKVPEPCQKLNDKNGKSPCFQCFDSFFFHSDFFSIMWKRCFLSGQDLIHRKINTKVDARKTFDFFCLYVLLIQKADFALLTGAAY